MIEPATQEPTSGRGKSAVRTCAACRTSAPARDLMRLALLPQGGLVVDWRRNLGGRGAHVCPTRSCIEAALNRRSLDRIFKVKVTYPKSEALLEAARQALLRNLNTLMGSCNAARSAAFGADSVSECISKGEAKGVVIADDSAIRERVESAARAAGIPVMKLRSKELVGELTGRRPTGVVAMKDSGLAKALMAAADRLEALY